MKATERRNGIGRLRPRRITLRARLTLIYGAMFLAAGIVLLGATYVLFNQQLTAPGGIIGSMLAPGETAPSQPDSSAPNEDDHTRTGVEPLRQGEQEVRLRESATTALITQGSIALFVVGGVAAGFGWLVAGRVLAPLHRVTETAARIAAAPAAGRSLHERIALEGPNDEIKDLADTFDAMVERLDQSFDGQRRFVANASHELRTPLTVGRMIVEIAIHRPAASDDVKQLGSDLLVINSRHERLITGLMTLAASENEVSERLPVDLADVIEHVTLQATSEAEEAGITIDDDAQEAFTSGDALLLERMVQNLVENGIRHNVDNANGWVRVVTRTRPDADSIEVEFSNTGPAVPRYEIPALFETFRRLNGDRLTAKGAGLGLSIVRSVARAHDGDVTAKPRDGGGLVVTVTLPQWRTPAS